MKLGTIQQFTGSGEQEEELADIWYMKAHTLIAYLLAAAFVLLPSISHAAGQPAWAIPYAEADAPYFVRLDAVGDVIVVGRHYHEAPEDAQIFVQKFDPDSTLIWGNQTTGPALKIPIAAALDQAGNVYVLAQYDPSTTSPVVVYKFRAADGGVDWDEPFYPAGLFRQTAARDLFVTPDGHAIVIANFVIDDPAHPLRSDTESFLLYFSPAGSLLWSTPDFFAEPSVSFERVKASTASIFVTGSLVTAGGDYDGFVAGYDMDGDSLWAHYSGLDPSTGVFLQGVALDSTGNKFVAFANSDSTSYRKYSSAGNILFTRKSAAFVFPYQNELAADPDGNIYYMVGDMLGNQRLQKRDPAGELVLDTVLGSGYIPFPVVYSRDGTLLTWNPAFKAAQYGLNGAFYWISDSTYATHGDFTGATTSETYWILYEYTADPNVLLRKLVKYDLQVACGDADGSGRIDISDAVYMVNYIFAAGLPPRDPAAGDYDCSGRTDVADIVRLINYFFAGGPGPCECD